MKQISIKIISPVILLLISTSVFTQENLDELELSKYYKHLHLARNHCFQGSKVNAKKEYNKALLILKDNTTKKYRAIYEEMLSTKKCKEIDQVAHRAGLDVFKEVDLIGHIFKVFFFNELFEP